MYIDILLDNLQSHLSYTLGFILMKNQEPFKISFKAPGAYIHILFTGSTMGDVHIECKSICDIIYMLICLQII